MRAHNADIDKSMPAKGGLGGRRREGAGEGGKRGRRGRGRRVSDNFQLFQTRNICTKLFAAHVADSASPSVKRPRLVDHVNKSSSSCQLRHAITPACYLSIDSQPGRSLEGRHE